MTKAELIKELQKYPDNAKIAFCIPKDYPLQDYCIVKVIELVDDIEWIEDIVNGVEKGPSIILKGWQE